MLLPVLPSCHLSIFLFRHSSQRNLVRHRLPGVVINLVQLYDVIFWSSPWSYYFLIFKFGKINLSSIYCTSVVSSLLSLYQ